MALNEPTVNDKGEVVSPLKVVRIPSVSVLNTGRNPAANVNITFNWKPQHYSLWPSRHHKVDTAPDGRFTIMAGTLPPKDFIVVDLLSVNTELPEITSAYCDQCTSTIVTLFPQEVHPRWKLLLAVWLMVLGLGAAVYLAISAIQLVVTRAT
jgi:hypothetical protein